jgi:hypothetical protein
LITRALVATGDNIVIAGFVLGSNNGVDRVVVRGIGPSLVAAGVPNALVKPTLELRDSNGALLVANNDWQDDAAQAAEITAVGLSWNPASRQHLRRALTLRCSRGRMAALALGWLNFTTWGRPSRL